MSIDELMELYRNIINQPVDSPQLAFDESGESVDTLLQTPSLRILVIRTLMNPTNVTLEVEIWLPNPNSTSLSSDTESHKADSPNKDLSTMLIKMIDHLQYLYKLHQTGFSLDVIKADCLWTASRIFSETPSREIFGLLLPP